MDTVDTKSVKIDADLQSRLTMIAERQGYSFNELAESILRMHADRLEHEINEYADDDERWQRYVESGAAISFDSIRSKLQILATQNIH